jgi:hypothetical protein
MGYAELLCRVVDRMGELLDPRGIVLEAESLDGFGPILEDETGRDRLLGDGTPP